MHLIRLTEQTHDVADVVDVQVHQRTARTGRVKGDRRFPGAESIVPAGILAEVALHQLHFAYAGQQFADLVVIFQILGGHGLEQEDFPAAGQIRQLLCLQGIDGHRLFHDDVLPRLDGHLGIAGVLVVRHGQIDHVHVLQQLKIVGGMLGDAVLFAQLPRRLCAALGAADALHRKR